MDFEVMRTRLIRGSEITVRRREGIRIDIAGGSLKRSAKRKEMNYTVTLTKRAVKDLKSIPLDDRRRILRRIEAMEDDLAGDVKKLTNHTPEYRLRCGKWRVLFEIEGSAIVIYRVLNRKEAY
jgi:mRNA interferase RelE/StbE